MQEQIEKKVLDMEGVKMSKVIIAGCACIYFSNLTPEDMDQYKTYAPEALTMYDEDDEAVFSLDIDDGPGSITLEKAVLSRSKSADGKATVTMLIDPECEDKLRLIQEKIGPAILQLEDLEEQLLENVGKLKERQDKANAMISYL